MILITGANGRPGSATVREFARNKEPVRALVRDPAKAGDLRELPGVEVVQGDMLWPETLQDALAGVDREIEINLSDRRGMLFPMLLGRTALARQFTVDPARSFLHGRLPTGAARVHALKTYR